MHALACRERAADRKGTRVRAKVCGRAHRREGKAARADATRCGLLSVALGARWSGAGRCSNALRPATPRRPRHAGHATPRHAKLMHVSRIERGPHMWLRFQ